jgi:hypothetical protein
MATQKHIQANRRNAQKSTLLPHEDRAAYHELHAAFIESWQPAGPAELCLVDQIAQSYWRIQRNRRLGLAMFNILVRNLKDRNGIDLAPRSDDDNAIVVAMTAKANERVHRIMKRYDRRAEAAYYRAIDQLRRLRRDRERQMQVEKSARPDTMAARSPESGSFGAHCRSTLRNLR